MTGVQLIGRKAVLEKFESFDTDTWALYQGKEFIVGGIGAESLDNWLTGFEQSGSTATYVLRVYDTEEVPTSATGNGEHIAKIGFKAVDAYEGHGIAGHSSKLMDRIGALEKQLKERDEEKDDDEPDLNTVIMGWLSDPAKLGQVASAVRIIFGTGGAAAAPVAGPAPAQAISGFGPAEQKADPVARIADALDRLEKKDPKLVEHLEKLATLSENDPALFSAVISKLDLL